MKIKTSSGKEIEVISVIATTMRGSVRLLISMHAETTMEEAAKTFDGLEWISTTGETAGMTTTYEGYSRITTISRAEDGTVRVTLTREE